MAAPLFESGVLATVTVNGNELPTIRFSIARSAKSVEFINSLSGTEVQESSTFRRTVVTIVADFDFNNNPNDAPFNITVGGTLSNVKCFLNQSAAHAFDGKVWIFSSLNIRSTPQEVEVDGKVGFSFQCGLAVGGTVTAPI